MEDNKSKIDNYKQKLATIEKEYNNISGELRDAIKELDTYRGKNEVLLKEVNELEIELDKLGSKQKLFMKKKEQLANKYDAIKESTIWRYTNLIRKVLRRLFFLKRKSKRNKGKKTNVLKRAEQVINKNKLKLLNFGFSEKAKIELEEFAKDDSNPILQRLAARELALWYANHRSKSGALKCLELLPIALQGEGDNSRRIQLSVLMAECYSELGNEDKAINIIEEQLENNSHSDLLIMRANLEREIPKRLEWVNKIYELFGVERVEYSPDKHTNPYDCLFCKNNLMIQDNPMPKVSVIMPVFNAEEYLHTAIDSILAQTWTNIEVLVVDDCSSDGTANIVKEYERIDSRVKYIKTKKNGGAYTARNLALSIAEGEYVTTNDSDDWSHPQKIEIQVKHLIENPEIIGNTSQQVRATNELKFFRRGNYRLMFTNMSSFMFRRVPVLEAIGYYDSVRFGADAECLRRIRKVFGREAITDLRTGPLSFQRQSSSSLTGNSAFGFHGFFMGARKEYVESQAYYHQKANTLYYSFPQKIRPFPVPEPMWPTREKKDAHGRRHFQVIIINDFRNVGTPIMHNLRKLEQENSNSRIGFVQMYEYDIDPSIKIRPDIRELLYNDSYQMIVYGEKVSCDLLIIENHNVLQEWQKYVPDIVASKVKLIINRTPSSHVSSPLKGFDPLKTQEHIHEYFGKEAEWIPNDSFVREYLIKFYQEDLKNITLSPNNWLDGNTITEVRH